jgi:hypothetical protein
MPSLQLSIPPQPSGIVPHVAFCAAQVVGVQPQTIGVPPPPHVCGGVQSGGLSAGLHPHWPCALHMKPPVDVGVGHVMPVLTVVDGMPFVQCPVWQSLPYVGTSALSATDMVPPFPSHSIVWQSPGVCGGFDVVGVPAAMSVVVQVLVAAAHVGCWQSSIVPGHSLSLVHWAQLPAASQKPGMLVM